MATTVSVVAAQPHNQIVVENEDEMDSAIWRIMGDRALCELLTGTAVFCLRVVNRAFRLGFVGSVEVRWPGFTLRLEDSLDEGTVEDSRTTFDHATLKRILEMTDEELGYGGAAAPRRVFAIVLSPRPAAAPPSNAPAEQATIDDDRDVVDAARQMLEAVSEGGQVTDSQVAEHLAEHLASQALYSRALELKRGATEAETQEPGYDERRKRAYETEVVYDDDETEAADWEVELTTETELIEPPPIKRSRSAARADGL